MNLQTFYIIIISAIITVIFRRKLGILRTSLFLFDTIGIGIFTIVGIEKGLSVDLSPVVCILLGTITACFGGVTRDILCNEIPVIFRKRSEEHTSELQSRPHLVCRLLLEKKKYVKR